MRVICHTWGCAVSVKMSGCAARFCPVCGNTNITIEQEPEDKYNWAPELADKADAELNDYLMKRRSKKHSEVVSTFEPPSSSQHNTCFE